MVIQSTVEQVDVEDKYLTRAYTVNLKVGDLSKRILTVTTNNDDIARKWIKGVEKNFPGLNIAGICFQEYDRYTNYGRYKCRYDFNDVITINVGAHCLIYQLSKNCGRFLDKFFGDYFLKTVGFDMANVCKRLKEKYGINVKNPLELRKLATEKREDLYHYDLYKYDLVQLAVAVIGKEYDVDMPEEKLMLIDLFERYSSWWKDYDADSDAEDVKVATIDAYLCLLIGDELIPEKDW